MKPPRDPAAILKRDAFGNKNCVDCLRWLPTDRFSPNKRKRDGLHSSCRECIQVSLHGITHARYNELLEMQGGTCAICKGPQVGAMKRYSVDHDHSCCPPNATGRSCGKCIRGLLCNKCNTAIGLLRDDVDTLRSAIDYLTRGLP